MHIIRRQDWEIGENQVTPERFVLGRRGLVAGAAAGLLVPGLARAQGVPRNPAYSDAGRPITPEQDATTYNNFYEFGTDKSIYRAAQRMPVSPWQIKIDGMVEKPRTIDLDDLLKQVRLEERVYRHRCVEAWAMTVPWTGFPMRDLLRICAPTSAAKYVEMETLADPKTMPGLRLAIIDWPYREGLAMAEASNDLAFIATGMYGKALPKQDGAPIRLVVPWKYGFKSIKSIVRINFTDKQPLNSWQGTQPGEYGFWANVNPAVPHPRWSQATERLLGTDERVPTQIYNGYGAQVASMYAAMPADKLFM
ncbi:MAG TPA: protein-methionine-sulfoxide reductase catalytic subunit MsrP [Acetobacteraceae bacterium]|nr:protein-methionine-sulfoxide reductase catalytic subunit MsrP [Acetobacteraceae bacterium]